MPQVGIFNNWMEGYGLNPTFNRVTILNTGRNLKEYHWFEDFITYPATNSIQQGSCLTAYWNGAGAAMAHLAALAARPGVVNMGTGTTAGGYCSFISSFTLASSGFLFGGGEYTFEGDIYLPDLSTLAEEFDVQFGWSDVYGAATDGVYFIYDRNTSLNWYAVTANNAARTSTDSAVAVVEDAWIRLKIIVNATGTSVAFYIDDVLVATNVLNIPIVAGRNTSLNVNIRKSAGVTSRSLYVDWLWYHHDLTASR